MIISFNVYHVYYSLLSIPFQDKKKDAKWLNIRFSYGDAKVRLTVQNEVNRENYKSWYNRDDHKYITNIWLYESVITSLSGTSPGF